MNWKRTYSDQFGDEPGAEAEALMAPILKASRPHLDDPLIYICLFLIRQMELLIAQLRKQMGIGKTLMNTTDHLIQAGDELHRKAEALTAKFAVLDKCIEAQEQRLRNLGKATDYVSARYGEAGRGLRRASEVLSQADHRFLHVSSLRHVQIPTQAGHLFQFDVGHHSELKPATIPISSRPGWSGGALRVS